MLVKYPWILSASILENFEKVLDFFDEEKVPVTSICFIFPPVIPCDLTVVLLWNGISTVNKQIWMTFQVPKVCSSQAIKNWPHILGCSVNKLKLMVEEFSEMDIKNKKLGHIIATSPQLLLRKPQEFHQVGSEEIRLKSWIWGKIS